MSMPDKNVYLAKTVFLMVVIPMVFLAVYPLLYVVLPESVQRLADLPQDLTMVLIFSEGIVPLYSVWLYSRARHRYRSTPRVLREQQDTRDVC